jgi:predicted hydrocarbon binding protein
MAEDILIYKNNIKALMKIVASLSHASDTLIGKAANTLMYQTGKDLGKIEGAKMDKTDDLSKALDMIAKAEEGVWEIELWKDKGVADYIFEDGGVRKAYLVFKDCPIRQVCMTHGVKQDEVICRITHGLFAGIMGEVMEKKVDLHVEHAGPNACKKIVEMK